MAKIFIAEDDALVGRMYENAFTLSGHDVSLASNGEEALEKLKTMSPKPDIILLDMMMPNLSGLDVTKKIKSEEGWKPFAEIPIMLITNLPKLTIAKDVEKAMSLGAVEYFLKSTHDPIELVKEVERIIAKRQGK